MADILPIAPHRQRAFVGVRVAGVDVSSRFNPRLMHLSVINTVEGADSCTVELDDKYGELRLPSAPDSIEIELGWQAEGSAVVFTGTVADLESQGQKSAGRTLTIKAYGADFIKSRAKSDLSWHLGAGDEDVTLKDAFEKAGKAAGVEVKIDKELGGNKRKYFMANNESLLKFGQRMASEFGGVFKITGNQAVLVKAGSGVNVEGDNLFVVAATAGKNLLAWRITPQVAKPQYATTGHTHFDPMKATWELAEKSITQGLVAADWAPVAALVNVGPQADGQVAQQRADADAGLSEAMRGHGWIVIDGEPRCKAHGRVILTGARGGVDGTYNITEVEHTFAPSTGFTTRLDVDLAGIGGSSGAASGGGTGETPGGGATPPSSGGGDTGGAAGGSTGSGVTG